MLARQSPMSPPADETQWIEVVESLAVGFAERAADLDDKGEIPLDNLRALNASGLDLAILPVEHGGQGVSFRTVGRILVILAKADPSTAALWLMHIGAAHGLVTLGSPSAAAFFASELAAGKRFANALSEPTSGNMFLMPQQVAEPVDGGFSLDGAKRFVSGCEIADYFLVNVLVDGAPSFFGVPKDDSISFIPIWDTMGMRATRSQMVSFTGTVMRSEYRCGAPAADHTNLISAGLPFISIGIAESAVDAFTVHAQKRFLPGAGTTLSKVQWLKYATAELFVALRGATLLAEQTMWLADLRSPEGSQVAVEAKLAANEVAKQAAALGVKAGGANGYLKSSPIQRHFRDAQAGALMAYSVEICSDVVGGWVLDNEL